MHSVLLLLALTVLCSFFDFTHAFTSPAYVNLASCKPFAVVAGATITNSGSTVVNGDLALSPGTAVTGFPPGQVFGTQHLTDGAAATCMGELATAITDANSRTPDVSLTGELGGMTLAPGVYKSSGGFAITNTLYLDGQNDPNAAWIFIMATTLIVNTGAAVVLLNYDTAQGTNVWWSCTSADIFTTATMQGTVMAYQSIAAQTGATTGPLMANIGQVTLLSNTVNSYNSFTRHPSSQPSTHPSTQPSQQPSTFPSSQPSTKPSRQPSGQPSGSPSVQPSSRPSTQPSSQPSEAPSAQPSSHPSRQPSVHPSVQPSVQPSEQPSFHPTRQPLSLPSMQPSSHPSCQPSAVPSEQPTVHPSTQPSAQPSDRSAPSIYTHEQELAVLRSISFGVRNGFAFAAVGTTGRVYTWGEAATGGNSDGVQAQLLNNVVRVVPARSGYAALKEDGTVIVWGAGELNRTAFSSAKVYGTVACHYSACVAVVNVTGEVNAVGSKQLGGDLTSLVHCPGCSAALSAGVDRIVTTAGAFAAIKTDGTLFVWGNEYYGGSVPTSLLPLLGPVQLVVVTMSAFAVLLDSGRVVTWGSPMGGGDSSAVVHRLTQVWHLCSSTNTFAAHRKDGALVVWGHPHHADTSLVASQLQRVGTVAHTFTASAALTADGDLVCWGKADGGGDCSAVQVNGGNFTTLYGNSRAFVAVNATGGVVAWGKAAYGGVIPERAAGNLTADVVSIHYTDRAFAALKSDGSVVVWGQAGHGGSPGAAVEALLTSGVHTICANDVAFSSIKTDGSVVAWGHDVSVLVDGVQFSTGAFVNGAQCA